MQTRVRELGENGVVEWSGSPILLRRTICSSLAKGGSNNGTPSDTLPVFIRSSIASIASAV